MKLHSFTMLRLVRDHLERMVFKNDPAKRLIILGPAHRKISVRVLQYLGRVFILPLLWLEEFTVLDPNGTFACTLMMDEEESMHRGERAFAIDTTLFAEQVTHCGLWAYREPGYWHCFDSYSVPLSIDAFEDFRTKYRQVLGADLLKPPDAPKND